MISKALSNKMNAINGANQPDERDDVQATPIIHGANGQKPSDTLLIQGLIAQQTMESLAQNWQCPWMASPLLAFPCGEWTLRPLPPIEQQSVVVVHDLGSLKNDALMALGLLTHDLVRAKVRKITVLAPYLPYGRQNAEKNAAAFKILGDIFHTFAIDHVITLDTHNTEQLAQWPLATQSLWGITLFLPALTSQAIDWVISPDHGGHDRARQCAEYLGCAWTTLSKTRTPKDIEIHHANPEIFRHKRCLIVDDILDTGQTLAKASAYLIHHQAKNVLACMTHALFSNGCLERIQACGLQDLWVSNSLVGWLNRPAITPKTLRIHALPWTAALSHKAISMIQ